MIVIVIAIKFAFKYCDNDVESIIKEREYSLNYREYVVILNYIFQNNRLEITFVVS